MATKDTVPGLLSKVAKFVRNPTKDWSELDQLDSTPESGYDKHALKEMIERKRQNDFVRRREFDQLRKLRSKGGTGVGSMARTSTFQSSLTTDQDGRAVTLKKIDEIEAQMSKQWWKGKQDGSDAPASGASGSAEPAKDRLASAMDGSSTLPTSDNRTSRFKSTKSDASGFMPSDQVDTAVGFGVPRAPVARGGDRRSAQRSAQPNQYASRNQASTVAFSTSELFAIEVDEMATDPELEEAAIRFANGDDAGAESSLLQALRGEAIAPEAGLSWVAALLDLYRVTAQREKFEQAVLEFKQRFGNLTPSWVRAASAVDAQDSQVDRQLADTWPRGVHAGSGSDAIWDCPAELTVAAMEQLREAMGAHPMPWHLGWSTLERIAPSAMPLMGELFTSLCDEPVDLRFTGTDTLVHVLRKTMPSGQRDIPTPWWAVRLNALRTMQLHDEFELAALDYCVTYEVSPPAWSPARCQFVSAAAQSAVFANTVPAGMHSGQGQSGTAPSGQDGMSGPTLELRGDVLGDATQVLAAAGGPFGSGDRVIVSCTHLVRIDFSAAGSILNWVAVRQSEGCQVQFRDVHRLVAAFFNVIGINEHARVVPKPI
jgi:ABC-type transporter Mla MlaB component